MLVFFERGVFVSVFVGGKHQMTDIPAGAWHSSSPEPSPWLLLHQVSGWFLGNFNHA